MKPDELNQLIEELKKELPELELEDHEWKTTIQMLLKNQPNQPINQSFKNQLKKELMNHMESKQPTTDSSPIAWKWIMPFLGGALAVLMVSVIVWPTNEPQQIAMNQEVESNQAMQKENKAGDLITIETNQSKNAFGEIDLDNAEGGDQAVDAAVSRPQSGGGNAVGMGGGGFADERMIMPYPGNRVNYEYQYTGGELPLEEGTTTVYQTKSNPPLATNLLNTLDLQGLNANSFSNLIVQQLNLKETEGDWPFIVNIDYENQYINLYQDYQVWTQSRCRLEDRCREEPQITKEEFANEATFIKAANDFLKKHNLQSSQMGDPYVEKYWEQYEPYEEPTYFPNSASVVYPLLIEGQKINQQWGQLIGIRIEVDVRSKRVSGANIPVLSLESSEYDANTKEQILEMASAGGNDGVTYTNPERVVELELDTPKKELRRVDYTTKDGVRKGIMVEMLIFPIKETPDKKQYQPYLKEIVVPIASNLYKQ